MYGESLQNLILFHATLCWFDYPLPLARFSTRCDHFQDSLDFEHRFREWTSLLSICTSWLCVGVYFTLIRDGGRFFVPFDSWKWCGLEPYRALPVLFLPVLPYFSSWVFESKFLQLIPTNVRKVFSVVGTTRNFWVTIDCVFGFICGIDRQQLKNIFMLRCVDQSFC